MFRGGGLIPVPVRFHKKHQKKSVIVDIVVNLLLPSQRDASRDDCTIENIGKYAKQGVKGYDNGKIIVHNEMVKLLI